MSTTTKVTTTTEAHAQLDRLAADYDKHNELPYVGHLYWDDVTGKARGELHTVSLTAGQIAGANVLELAERRIINLIHMSEAQREQALTADSLVAVGQMVATNIEVWNS